MANRKNNNNNCSHNNSKWGLCIGMGNGIAVYVYVYVWGRRRSPTHTQHTNTHRRCDYGVFGTINCQFLTVTSLNTRFGTLHFIRSIYAKADTHTRVPRSRFKGYATGPVAPSAGRDAAPSWRLMIVLASRSL